ncbi:hypothetical protein G7Y89_g6277 [Cudoniella acicularis]|uniref:Uncharacterized protein n=1 Tax=Cudoniella acicularis TaxID=354080 RepID=A0A8H4RN88_9HELO|nr:hypothetical protein G7Y89_g6277 [Cudoniella acicularis]
MVPLSEKISLELKFGSAQQDLAKSRERIHHLQVLLLRSALYGEQLPNGELAQISMGFEKCVSLPQISTYLHHRGSLLLADSYDTLPLKPLRGYTYEPLQFIYEDITGLVSRPKQPTVAQYNAERHFPWLGPRVKDIVLSASPKDPTLFIEYLNKVINLLTPSGIAGCCLFVIAADISRRAGDVGEETVWLKLYC